MAFAEDLADFFDTDDFAAAATYTPQGAGGIATQAIELHDVEVEADGGVYLHKRAYLLRSDHVANPKNGDTITVAGTDYTVDASLKDDGKTILVAVR